MIYNMHAVIILALSIVSRASCQVGLSRLIPKVSILLIPTLVLSLASIGLIQKNWIHLTLDHVLVTWKHFLLKCFSVAIVCICITIALLVQRINIINICYFFHGNY